MKVVVALLALAACGRLAFDPSHDPDDPACAPTAFVDRCAAPAADRELVLAGGTFTYDTATGVLVDPAGSRIVHATSIVDGARVIAATDVRIEADAILRATGTLPIAIVATSIDIAGVLDAGAHRSIPGAGAWPTCLGGAGAGENDQGGGGGGGGGGFGGTGGAGGSGDSDDGAPPAGISLGGIPGTALPDPGVLRGGCAGGRGGDGDGPGGHGGAGGGGVLLAADLVAISGLVRAGGGGGEGGALADGLGDGGGGGGGSGGMIVIDATAIELTGVLAANGGGGGEGGFNFTVGIAGADARDDGTRALGGSSTSPTTNDGGAGGALLAIDGATPTGPRPVGGSGGGGGSAGLVIVLGPMDGGGTISPAAR